MRFFVNLSVGRKLAASAILAILLLGLLVGSVRLQLGVIGADRAAQHEAELARTAALEAAVATSLSGIHLREALAAQTPQALATASAAADASIRQVTPQLTALAAHAADASERQGLAAVEAAAQERAMAQLGAVALRGRLLELRDRRFMPLMADYDQAYEAISANLAYDLPPEAQEEARQRLQTFHAAVNEVRLGTQRFLATGDAVQARRVRRAAAQQRVHLRALTSVANGQAAQDMRRVQQVTEAMTAASDEILQTVEMTEQVLQTYLMPAGERLRAGLAGLMAATAAQAEERAAAADATAAAVGWQVPAIGAALALLLALSGWLTARAIGAPLRRLLGTIGAIAAGNALAVVPDRGRRDEIGRIAEALEALRGTVHRAFAQQQMLEQMPTAVMTADPNDDFRISYLNPATRVLLQRVEHLLACPIGELEGRSIDVLHRNPAQQRAVLADPAKLPHHARIRLGEEVLDLTVSAIQDRDGKYLSTMLVWSIVTAQARLADSFATEVGAVVEAVATAAAQVQGAAEVLTGTAATSGREADAVAEASSRAGADVQAVAASAEELAASVAEITRQVSDGAAVAQAAAAAARATDATVQGLAQAANRIGDVVRLIGNIAGQTNLLALNATIEAARAGEAGKGFAVVASEVKTLASQTAKATEEISQQIGGIQASTGAAVEALRAIGETVERMTSVTTAIAAAVEQQGAATREIARSAAQVAEGTSAVAHRIGDVRQAAGETGEASASLLGAATDLTGHAAALRGRAADFLAMVKQG